MFLCTGAEWHTGVTGAKMASQRGMATIIGTREACPGGRCVKDIYVRGRSSGRARWVSVESVNTSICWLLSSYDSVSSCTLARNGGVGRA